MSGEDRGERLARTQHTKLVGLELTPRSLLAVSREKAAFIAASRVIDEKRYIARTDGGRRNFLGLSHIKPDRLDTTLLDGRWNPCAGVHLASAASEQFPSKGQAYTPVGTGNESNGILDLHDSLLVI